MQETKRTYEQYCTHAGRNVVMEETILQDGSTSVQCTNENCRNDSDGCKNKLRQN